MEDIQKMVILGVPSDIIRYGSDDTPNASLDLIKRRIVFLFICGNPGTLCFYSRFLKDLYQKLISHYNKDFVAVEVHAVGHANHHLKGDDDLAHEKKPLAFDLEFQILHKLAYLDEAPLNNHLINAGVEVIVIAHSIGAYIALTMLARHKILSLRTTHLCLLMPFIRWGALPMYHRLRLQLFNALRPVSHNAIASVMNTLCRMPKTVRRVLIRSITGFDGESLQLVADDLLTPRLVENFLMMGAAEISSVPRDEHRVLAFLALVSSVTAVAVAVSSSPDKRETDEHNSTNNINAATSTSLQPPPPSSLPPPPSPIRTMLLYTDDDLWAPEGDARHISLTIPRVKVVYEPGLTHGFTLPLPPSQSQSQSRDPLSRAEKVCNLLLDFILSEQEEVRDNGSNRMMDDQPRSRL